MKSQKSSPIIKFHNVSFAYEKNSVLENVNVSISPHEFIGIFGPNGGGKTTFLKLLMGFLKPTRGTITVFGKNPVEARTKIGYVPQALRFDKQFPISVFELVLMGALSELSWWGSYSKEVKKKAEIALKKVGLWELSDRAFGTLSGGQAQRALIARALMSSPDLLLLDEPTASIDSEAEKEIHQILQNLKGTTTILMVTHDLQTIIGNVERVLCVRREVTSFLPGDVCEHFALGLYHSPLL